MNWKARRLGIIKSWVEHRQPDWDWHSALALRWRTIYGRTYWLEPVQRKRVNHYWIYHEPGPDEWKRWRRTRPKHRLAVVIQEGRPFLPGILLACTFLWCMLR